jgi:hypothetical protein
MPRTPVVAVIMKPIAILIDATIGRWNEISTSDNLHGAFLVLEGRSFQDRFSQESVPRAQKQIKEADDGGDRRRLVSSTL